VLLLAQLRCTSSNSCYEPPTSMSILLQLYCWLQ
jgi:hypothetical protein